MIMKYLVYTNDKFLAGYSSLADAVSNEENITIKEMSDADFETFQRDWRNKELKSTDWIVPVTDHPERASYLTYRTNLRDWPSTDDFPNTKPTL